MQLKDIKNVAIIGAGTMGHGIAQTYALGGYHVSLNDVSDTILKSALDRMRDNLETFAENDFISRSEVNNTLSRITPTTDLRKAVDNADFVTEAAIEDIEVKRELFNQLDALCPQRTVIASNSSALPISDFGSGTKREDRLVLTHWFNPPHIVPTVEIIRGHKTSDETVDLAYALLKKIGKLPVKILKEIPGYLVVRIQIAMMREAWSLWEQGIASAEDIDVAVKGSFGLRLASIGPFLTADLGGLDIWYGVAKYLLPVISDSHEPPLAIKKMVEAGELGMKTGKGVFDHNQEQWDRIVKQRDKEFLQCLRVLYQTK